MVITTKFFWPRRNVFLCFFVATSLTLVIAHVISETRLHGVHLAHLCAKPHSESEEGLPVIMLHGLTDTKETWEGIYGTIPLLTHRRVCIYDARNHGESGWSDTFDVDVLADDLKTFMKDMKIEKATLVGHSMGGLTVMKFALKNPSKVEGLFVEDISPLSIPEAISEYIIAFLKLMLRSLTAIPADADEDTAKKAVVDFFFQELNQTLPENLLTRIPIHKVDGAWKWKSNIEVFIKALEDPSAFLGKMEGQYNGKVFLIYGKDSQFKVNEDEKGIRELFPNSEFLGVEGADHVIHPHFPEFTQALIKFLK